MSAQGDRPAPGRRSHDPETMKAIVNRLKRADGQLHALVSSITPEADCREVLTQLAAVSKALDRAGFAITVNAMRDCADTGVHDDMTRADLEKLFLSLA
ncbi:metal-sensitive transcriptional regulator [Pseudolysinimonas sp.]|uniref:metal-sensitive transcriptional regulator n=1 Tax=Pseudolysinimonas sp. TaxID=2680009 RepID=UPI003F7F2E0F